MKHNQYLYFLFVILLLASLSCQAVLVPWLATPTPLPLATLSPTLRPTSRPSATFTPVPTLTEALTPTPTEGLVGEFQIYEDVMIALDFLRADWKYIGPALEHRKLSGCFLSWGMASGSSVGTSKTVIGGFTWAGGNGNYALKLGDDFSAGFLTAQYGASQTSCRKAVESLLKSVHALRAYAQAGECRYAPAQRLKVGDTAIVLSSSYLRTKPLWAEDTRIRLVSPAEKLTLKITGGPVCAIYKAGWRRGI